MPQDSTGPTPEQEAPKSLHDIVADAYAEHAGEAPADDGSPVDDGQSGRARDKQGRFVAKSDEPGSNQDEVDTSPDSAPSKPEKVPPVTPPQPAHGSIGAPADWSEADRQMLAKAPPDMQAWALRRHSEMQADYHSKVTEAATATRFTQALTPIFQDPVIAQSLQQVQATPYDAIQQWAAFHKRAMDPDPGNRFNLLADMAQRMGFDPAAVLRTTPNVPQGLSEQDMADPAIRFFAENSAKLQNTVRQLGERLEWMQRSEADRQYQNVVSGHRREIDSYADAKDTQGRLLHPYFDRAIPTMTRLLQAYPEWNIEQAYNKACDLDDAIRAERDQQRRMSSTSQDGLRRAQQAARSNVRGSTSSTASHADRPNGTGGGVRAALEAAAEEIGFTGE